MSYNIKGMEFQRYFTESLLKGGTVFDDVTWQNRTATITNSKGEVIFEQKGVRVPANWSQQATNIVVSKYFYGKMGTPEREQGVDQLIKRVVDAIVKSGISQGYFSSEDSSLVFRDELSYLLLHQMVAFNSPVWFNVGCDLYDSKSKAGSWHWVDVKNAPGLPGVAYEGTGYKNPQCSACFINSIDDTMEGIMHLATTEAMLFKFGSGTGTNFSALRSSVEPVSGGGTASGPLSFMKGLDAFAGVIKSGGKTRRAAKMAILNADHPDVEAFIDCKLKEDKKAQALMRAGYDGTSGPDSEAYASVFYQNANNSVRASDEFMRAAQRGLVKQEPAPWKLKAVKDGRTIKTVEADQLILKIAKATWECGDPGMQFDDTINKWHTCKTTARINASNPCSEYMFLDDTACNLASFNLMKFTRPDGTFSVPNFRRAIAVMITAMDILVDMSGYPTEKIAKNSHDFRPLGLGYANLGALLMSMGLAYDSDKGRAFAAVITSIMTGQSYLTSLGLAKHLDPLIPAGKFPAKTSNGAFPGNATNLDSMAGVMRLHRQAAGNLYDNLVFNLGVEWDDMVKESVEIWDSVVDRSMEYGFRNSQVTVLAPTGTIGFMMDCDTTGIEPELALIKYKKLVGGGQLKIINQTVPAALKQLGYTSHEAESILAFIDAEGTPEGSGVKAEHLDVFDTAFRPSNSTRTISYQGHIHMMAAVQPFLSGAISKTVNMPNEATEEEIAKAYIEGWELGLKSIAIYRDGSKSNQVLVTSKENIDLPIGEVDWEPTLILAAEHLQGVPSAEIIEVLTRQFGPYIIPAHLSDNPGAPPRSVRHKLPNTRAALTHKFSIIGHDGYITVGLYQNGQPGEIFITMAKEGSTISGFMDSFALVFSIALQHGVPLETLVSKLENTRFEPSGWTGDPTIGYAKSIMDYLARWLKSQYLVPRKSAVFPTEGKVEVPPILMESVEPTKTLSSMFVEFGDAPACPDCGNMTVKNGSCFKCTECGGTTGCS